MGNDNVISAYAILEGSISIGDRNTIGAHTVIFGPATIGSDNSIDPHVVINTEAEIRGEHRRGTQIGSHNVFKEFVSIQGGDSIVGDHCFLMSKTHIAHDCALGDHVTMATAAVLGGHVAVHNYATLGIGATVHQRMAIGEGAMIGMNSAVISNVAPWTTVVGSPAVKIGLNTKGMERWGRRPPSSTSDRMS